MARFFSGVILCFLVLVPSNLPAEIFAPGNRVVFLGDSVTAAGHDASYLDMQLRIRYMTILDDDLGLPSEGVTGLSERPHPFLGPMFMND